LENQSISATQNITLTARWRSADTARVTINFASSRTLTRRCNRHIVF
jgi:hypothetical protein